MSVRVSPGETLRSDNNIIKVVDITINKNRRHGICAECFPKLDFRSSQKSSNIRDGYCGRRNTEGGGGNRKVNILSSMLYCNLVK